MVKQLNKFSPNLADHMKPLHNLLSSQNQWMWGESQDKKLRSLVKYCAFNQQQKLLSLWMHHHSDWEQS